MTASNDRPLTADQGGPPVVPPRTLVSQAALLTEQQGCSGSARADTWNPGHLSPAAGRSKPHTASGEAQVPATAPATTRPHSKPHKPATRIGISDDPPQLAGQVWSPSVPTQSRISCDPLLTARQSADELNISLPAFWKGVADGRLPAPFYVLPRAPRWRQSELRVRLEGRQMRPAEAKLARWRTNSRST
jgi:predicted DNA-binding transcriptional regulator AlpA